MIKFAVMLKNVLTMFLVIVLHSLANAQEPTIRFFYVGDEKTRFEANNNIQACYKIKVHKDSSWKPFPYEIEGYIWEPGVQSYVEVEEMPILDAAPNQAPFKYRLIRTIENRNMVLRNAIILADNRWKLINLQVFRDVLPAARRLGAYIEFNLDSNYATGFGGCNTFNVGATYSDGSINFYKLNSTLMTCANDSLEKKVLEVFNGEVHYYFRNNMLFISGSNMVTLHFRPEKRKDSLINELSLPKMYRGNTFKVMPNLQFTVTLDDEKEAGQKSFLFRGVEMTELEKKTIAYKMVNAELNDVIAEIRILKSATNKNGLYNAILIFRDGTKRNIQIKNAV